MSRELLKNLIDYVPQQDVETIYRVIVKFIPEDVPEADEVESITHAMNDRNGTVSHNLINWD